MTRQTVTAPNAPSAGPYSHGVWAGDLFYLSGQAAVDPSTAKLVAGDVAVQAAQCFKNLFGVLAAAGLGPQHVIKVNVYLTDLAFFPQVNEIMATYFQQPYPARAAVGVAVLPRGALVEIEAVMVLPE